MVYYLNEKASREYYAKKRLKDGRYGEFTQDKDDPNRGKLKTKDGEYEIVMNGAKKKKDMPKHEEDKKLNNDLKLYNDTVDKNNDNTAITTSKIPGGTAAVITGRNKEIALDKEFFKLKGSRGSARSKALLNHEIGHHKLHNTSDYTYAKDDDHPLTDKEKKSRDTIRTTYRSAFRGSGSSYKDSDDAANNIASSLPDTAVKEDKERDKGIKAAEKYEKKDNSHSNSIEFEADRFAANRTSEGDVKRGLRDYAKHAGKAAQKSSGKVAKDLVRSSAAYKDLDKKELANSIKDGGKHAADDLLERGKALKDKELRNNKSYKPDYNGKFNDTKKKEQPNLRQAPRKKK